jgi:GNAT superfamily N-acetyltransferase
VVTASVRIRPTTREEWERVRDLRLRSLGDAPDAFGSTFERERAHGETEWAEWIEGWEGATNIMFVAERGEDWIGMAVGSRTGDEPEGHLYGMWVDPSWRKQGIGTRLVEAVIGWARSWGAGALILGVTETNDGAAGFYQHLGFVDTGERYPLREQSPMVCQVLRRRL